MVSKLGVRRRILAAESRDQRLRARISGEWTKEKLAILGAYAPAFVRACKRAEGGCFIDAFAGSGLNVDRGGREFEGSAQIAAKLPFRAVYLIDNDPANTASLQALNLGGNVRILTADANELLPSLLSEIPDWLPTRRELISRLTSSRGIPSSD